MGSMHPASEVAALAARWADRTAVVDRDGEVTYRTLFAMAAGIGQHLISQGYRPGDTIATLFRNGIDAVAASYGAMIAGLVEAPVNPALGARELAHCLAVCGARAILTTADSADRFASFHRPVVTVDGIAPAVPEPHRFPRVEADAPARVVFTSGTSGPPKGALHTQAGRWTANLLLRAGLPHPPRDGGRVLLMTPFAHGTSLLTFAYLASGGSVILMDGIDADRVLSLLEEGACDAMFAPPTALAKIVAAAEGRRIAGLRTIFCGTAVLTPTLYRRARAIFGPVVRVTYGKSEVFNPITVMEADETDAWYAEEGEGAAVGWPAPGVEVAIRDEDGRELPPGAVGEVALRARHLMAGYLTLDGFRPMAPDEFHDTGDLGTIDARGRLRLVGRAADMIKSGGYKVAPDEVERALAAALAPAEVAVVGLPSEYWGEVVVAAVEAPPPDWRERVAAAAAEMTGYKRPRLLVPFAQLPRNGTGKIVRAAIRTDILARYRLVDGSRPALEPRDAATAGTAEAS